MVTKTKTKVTLDGKLEFIIFFPLKGKEVFEIKRNIKNHKQKQILEEKYKELIEKLYETALYEELANDIQKIESSSFNNNKNGILSAK